MPFLQHYSPQNFLHLGLDFLFADSLEQSLRVGQFGNLLKHVVPVEVNPHGFLLSAVDNHYQMPDGSEDLIASGAALAGGILLKPLFRGTGYDTNQRTQTDFGSNVYVIEEM